MTDVLGPLLQHAVRAGAAARADRRQGDHRADGADGRRGPQPQPGRHADAAARAAARVIDAPAPPQADVAEAVAVRRRQRPLLPQPGHAGVQARARTPPAASRARRVVTAMARNGTDFGIQVSGTGDRWFTGPANTPEGLYLGAYGPDDANPDIGDSAITETAGIGGFAMAAAPGDRPVRRRRRAGRAARPRADVRDHPRPRTPPIAIPILEFRGHADRHRRRRGRPDRHPAADQHRHGRPGRRHRPGRRRPGHAADGVLPRRRWPPSPSSRRRWRCDECPRLAGARRRSRLARGRARGRSGTSCGAPRSSTGTTTCCGSCASGPATTSTRLDLAGRRAGAAHRPAAAAGRRRRRPVLVGLRAVHAAGPTRPSPRRSSRSTWSTG